MNGTTLTGKIGHVNKSIEMQSLDWLYDISGNVTDTTQEYEIVKKAVLRAEEKTDKEIAFDLVNEKRVDIKMIHWAYPSVEAYNVWVREHKDSFPREELTKDEFEFIGRLAGAK